MAYENISATGENAALPHYAPTATKSSIINTTTPYLNDSGAQYSDGTTIDTTRTVHFGRPTPEQRLAFTCILQGHIAIGSAVFPMNTTGFQLDLLARLPLCKHGLTFGHGTGHLIGSYLSVHESESGVGIGSSKSFNITPLQPGNVISNEPGFYREGEFGIRTESIVTVVDKEIAGLKFLGFERLTVVPIQSSLCDLKLMSKEERNWLKDHNDDCRRKLLPFLKDDKRARAWLKRQ